jgi:hypothetical protein
LLFSRAPQDASASLAAKTRLRLKHLPLRRAATSCGNWAARLNHYLIIWIKTREQ